MVVRLRDSLFLNCAHRHSTFRTVVVRPEGEASVRDVDEVESVEDGALLREAEVDARHVLDG